MQSANSPAKADNEVLYNVADCLEMGLASRVVPADETFGDRVQHLYLQLLPCGGS